jgi:protein-disulfide isomerase
LVLTLFLAGAGCHAQVSGAPAAVPGAAKPETLSPELARRIEILIRQRTDVPAEYTMVASPRTKSEVSGYDEVDISFTDGTKTSKPIRFLLSTDGKTLAQMTKFDISRDPKTLVSAADRPARGGPANAPVTIVLFDDLECPFCAKMHAQLFPALTARYGNEVRVVYRDYPLSEIHPWALRAAIDSSCLAAQTTPGYWNLVDYVHLHAGEMGGKDKSLAQANSTLDTLTLDEGKRQNIDQAQLTACVLKQDATAVNGGKKDADKLGVEATPALFINGERLDGAVPIEYVYRMVDSALTAEGVTPPPPVPLPAPEAPAAKAGAGN